MKKLYDKIMNDEEIINIYNKIHVYEDCEKGWAYHDFNHVLNVSNLVERILLMFDYDEDYIYGAKIACILHDTGALQGKDDHALRSYEYAKNYFEKNNVKFRNVDEVLEAIKIHSDGFETNNVIALALILSDKLDVKHSRVAKEGSNIIGNRQFLNIEDIEIKKEKDIFVVNFVANEKIDIKELNNFYFTLKIFKAIKSFCAKMQMKYQIKMNGKDWNIDISKNIID